MIRAPKSCRVVFDGQSRANTPDPAGVAGFGWPWTRLVMVGRGVPAYWVAVGGTSLTSLATNFSIRAGPAIVAYEPTIYVLCGGFTDYNSEGDTGAQVYADAGALADLARGQGAAYVICTTTLPATPITGSKETARQAGNALILADASSKFDDTIDFDVTGLDDPADTDSYFDGVHIYGGLQFPFDATVGTGKAATVAASAISAAITAVT